ncbi:MAG: TetR/AcrR family transcriptional regulator [Bacteroidota bacterium]
MGEQLTDISEMNISTEEKIKLAAARVFTKKGYDATTTRDIADMAGIKLGSLHYYYRSKEKLFQIVTQEPIIKMASIQKVVFLDNIPLYEKIRKAAEQYVDFFVENPLIPMFIISESEKNPDRLYDIMDFRTIDEEISKELKKLNEEGIIREISVENFIGDLIGLLCFPFMAKLSMMYSFQHDEAAYKEWLISRKEHIPELLINYLYINPPEE